jgi:hypothetical protein
MEPPPEVSVEAVGLYLAEAVQLMGTLEAAGIHEQEDSAPLPRGLLSCGEACRLVPAVIAMALQLHPELADPGVLETILRNALTTGTTGAVQ